MARRCGRRTEACSISTRRGTFERGCGLWQSVQATPAMPCVEECQAIVGEWS